MSLIYIATGAVTDRLAEWQDADTVVSSYSIADIVQDTTPQLGGSLDANGHAIAFDLNTLTSGTNITVDWNLGNKATVTLGHNATFAFTAPPGACSLQLIIKQDGTGGRSVTLPATIRWADATAPTFSTAINAIDIVSFLYDGTHYYGQAGTNFATA